jgi:hypothetical protein
MGFGVAFMIVFDQFNDPVTPEAKPIVLAPTNISLPKVIPVKTPTCEAWTAKENTCAPTPIATISDCERYEQNVTGNRLTPIPVSWITRRERECATHQSTRTIKNLPTPPVAKDSINTKIQLQVVKTCIINTKIHRIVCTIGGLAIAGDKIFGEPRFYLPVIVFLLVAWLVYLYLKFRKPKQNRSQMTESNQVSSSPHTAEPQDEDEQSKFTK